MPKPRRNLLQCSQLWPNSANVAEFNFDLAERFLFSQPLFSRPKWPNFTIGQIFLNFWDFCWILTLFWPKLDLKLHFSQNFSDLPTYLFLENVFEFFLKDSFEIFIFCQKFSHKNAIKTQNWVKISWKSGRIVAVFGNFFGRIGRDFQKNWPNFILDSWEHWNRSKIGLET